MISCTDHSAFTVILLLCICLHITHSFDFLLREQGCFGVGFGSKRHLANGNVQSSLTVCVWWSGQLDFYRLRYPPLSVTAALGYVLITPLVGAVTIDCQNEPFP